MDIIISSEANVATPPAGYVTLFINTDRNNTLCQMDSNRVVSVYSAAGSAEIAGLAEAWMDAAACSLKKGLINAEQYQDIMNQGFTVQTNTTTDVDGNQTTTVSVGSRSTNLVAITLGSYTEAIAALATAQIAVTFDPTNTSNQTLSYVTSNAAIATVSATGLITGVAAGVATITVIPAADPSKSKVVTVTVS
jgi:hypothetical protein